MAKKTEYNDEIVAEAKIKDCKITDSDAKVNFEVDFNLDQYRKIAKIIKTNEPVALIIRPIQGELFGEPDQE